MLSWSQTNGKFHFDANTTQTFMPKLKIKRIPNTIEKVCKLLSGRQSNTGTKKTFNGIINFVIYVYSWNNFGRRRALIFGIVCWEIAKCSHLQWWMFRKTKKYGKREKKVSVCEHGIYSVSRQFWCSTWNAVNAILELVFSHFICKFAQFKFRFCCS